LNVVGQIIPNQLRLYSLDRFKFSPIFPSEFKGLFSGTYNKYYDLELSFKFIQALKKIANLEVDWAKPKESHTNFLNAGESFVFSVNQPEMANVISQYSFGISICKENAGLSLKAAMPTKIAEFLAVGRPVVVNAGLGDCDEIFRESGIGVIISQDDDLGLKALELMSLISDKDTPNRCRQAAAKYFGWDFGVRQYLDIYKEMQTYSK
jgi:glycosyltransferase involved in cell wall biosynthesis